MTYHPETLKFMDSFTVQKQWLVANCCYCEICRSIQRNTLDVFIKYINICREKNERDIAFGFCY